MTLIPVTTRYANGWPKHGDACTAECEPHCAGPGVATYGPIGEAMIEHFEWDAHFSAYSAPEIPRRLAGKESIDLAHPSVVLLVLDVEPAKHVPPTAEWYVAESEKIGRLLAAHPGGYAYTTRGGYRVIYRLAVPFALLTAQDARTWALSYRGALDDIQTRFQIVADYKCSDWTRLYRLPFVVRDGEVQEPDTFGDPANIGTWELKIIEAPITELHAVNNDGAPASPRLLADVRHRLAQLGPAIEGQGGDAKTFQACAMVLRGYALNDAEAVEVLTEWDRTNQPPWGAELRAKMDNAANYASGEEGEERAKFEERDSYLLNHGVNKLPGQPAVVAPPPSAASQVLAQLFANASTSAIEASEPTAEAGTYFAVLQQAALDVDAHMGAVQAGHTEEPFFVPAGELFTCEYPPTPWLVRGMIAEGGIAMIGGEAKYGKSWIATEIAAAVASGTDVFEEYPTKAGSVAYFYTEDLKKSIRNKLRAFAATRGIPPSTLAKRLHVQPRGRSINVTNAGDCARIVASCRMIPGGVSLLVLDPLRNIHDKKENDADTMAEVFKCLRMLSDLLDCTVLLVHHAGKSTEVQKGRRGGQKLRGSGAIHGFLDAGIYLDDLKTPDSGSRTMLVETEVKGARSAGNFELTLTVEDDAQGEAIKAKWSTGTKGETTAKAEDVATWEDMARDMVDAMMVAEAKGSPLRVTREIKGAIRGGNDAKNIAIKLAKDRGWLRQDVTSGVYTLADAGRTMARARLGARPAPSTAITGAHPASGFIKPLE